jgi:lysozyme
MKLRERLIAEEGWKNIAYRDTLGVWTIGVGHTGPEVHEGLVWADSLVGSTLDADIAKKTAEVVYALPWFGQLNEARQAVLIQMAFQMGTRGLLGFPRTLAAVHDGHWDEAANGMLMSKWAQQTPGRAHRLSRQMRLGVWIDSNGLAT